MKKQVIVNLFGATGNRQIGITTRGGFLTRHVKVPRETVPSIFGSPTKPKSAPVAPKPSEVSDPHPETSESNSKKEETDFSADAPPSLFEILRYMTVSENHSGWLIIDEILFVATTQYKMKFNQNTLLDALRYLYRKGVLEYRKNRFDQHTFRIIENQEHDLKA